MHVSCCDPHFDLAGRSTYWTDDDEVLRENEFIVNEPYTVRRGQNNSVILEDRFGFRYRKKYSSKDATFWICSKLNQLKCKALVKAKGKLIVTQKNEHNHDASVYKLPQ